MKFLEKYIAYTLLIVFIGTSTMESLFAEEGISMHSIDELPSYYIGNGMISAHVDETEDITTSIM